MGLTQEQLAGQLGVARRTIINHETEFHPIPLDVLNRLEELGADCFYILYGQRSLEFSIPLDPALLEKVLGWSDVLCRDRKGRPFPQGHIARFVAEAYAYLASEGSETDDEAKVEMALAKIARRAA